MSVKNKESIFKILAESNKELSQLGAERIGLFGSFVHGKQREESDVDLLVDFKSGAKSFDSFMMLSETLEKLLGRQIDLVTRESLSPYIGSFILSEVEYGSVD